MLSTSQEGRGYPAGTMGARFTARGVPAGDEGAPIGLPEAVEVGRPDVVRGRGCPWVRSCSDRGEGVRSVWRVYSRHRSCPDCEQGAPSLSRYKIRYIYNVLGYFQTKVTLN